MLASIRSSRALLYSLFLDRGWEISFLWEAKRELRVNADLDRRKLAEDLNEALLADAFILPTSTEGPSSRPS
jgi:hypothetical protein